LCFFIINQWIFIIIFCIFIAIKWFFRRQKRQSAADYHYLLVFDKQLAFFQIFYVRQENLSDVKTGEGAHDRVLSEIYSNPPIAYSCVVILDGPALMQHPLLALAAAYDQSVPPSSVRPSLKRLMEDWLESDPGEAICHYAAHFSVLTQASQLGEHGILEEPQTDALYGLLASSFWHARVLDDAYQAFEEATHGVDADRSPRACYWLHQSKHQEAESGFDFGIITPCSNHRVKVTLFQAKRPANDASSGKLSLGYVVREARGLRLHRDDAEWTKALQTVQAQISAAKKSEDCSSLRCKEKNLLLEKRWWSAHAGPRMQLCALATIRDALASGATVASALKLCEDHEEFAEYIARRGNGSLFNKRYAYEQYYAFLATAISGWQWEGSLTHASSWCYYVQWVNRSAGEPWSIRLEHALASLNTEQDTKQDKRNQQPFAEVLAASLSSTDGSVGLMIHEDYLSGLTGLIKSDLPEIVWGAVAEQSEIARNLLLQCGVPEGEIVPDISQPCPRSVAPVQQPENDLGNGKAPRREPRSPVR
jgi:hypothetical protein